MKPQEQEKTNKAYNNWFEKDPTPAEQVGWSGKEDQTSRFTQFLEFDKLKPLKESRLLDVGCGYGNFLDFLEARKIKLKEYTGIDINQNFIKIAQKKKKGTFILGDFLDYKFLKPFDFAIASGIFNVKCAEEERAYGILFETVAKMMEDADVAAAFNFLSQKESKGFELTGQMQIYDKKKVIEWCKKQKVKTVKVIEGYDEFDTTIILIK